MVVKDYGKTIKCKLKNILKPNVNYNLFFECIHKSNDIYFICSNFINSYVLYCFNNEKDIPNLDYDFIRMAFKALSKKSVGPKPKGKQLNTINDLNKFYEKEFVYLLVGNIKIKNINDHKFDSTNLSYIFNLFAKEMETSYENHIVLNFFKYINQFVNEHFIIREIKRLNACEYSKLSKDQKLEYKLKISQENEKIKNIKKEIIHVKTDLIDQTLNSDKKYHEWINLFKSITFPKLESKIDNYYDDIKIDHYKYLHCMLKMNQDLEKSNKKLFSSVSLRTEMTDKYVHIDTSTLKDIFGEINSGLTNEKIWSKYFNINPKKLKLKDHSFNFQISTDGLAVSINFIKNDKIESKNKKIKAKADASKNTKQLRKTKTKEEIVKIKEKQIEKNKEEMTEKIKKDKEVKKKQKEIFKKLPEEEQFKITLKIKLTNNKYEYIEDALKDPHYQKQFTDWFLRGLIKVVDPGKRAPLTIYGTRTTDEKLLKKTEDEIKNNIPQIGKERNGKVLFSYTTAKRIADTKRKKYGKLIDNKKKEIEINNKSIKELEQELSQYNSKTVNYDQFKKYAKIKLKIRCQISKYYLECYEKELVNATIKNKSELEEKIENLKKGVEYNDYLRKLRWFGFINKKRHEDNMLNEIEKVYGKDAIFIIGDWGNKGRLKHISTPNVGMKKMLSKRFKVYLIDEYNTSKLHYKTEEETENLTINMKYKKDGAEYEYKKKIHSILTCKMSNKSRGCINRDYNACLNMCKIVKSLIENKKRPEKYCRSNKKLTNPSKGGKVNSAKK